jgi:hypothetical protein
MNEPDYCLVSPMQKIFATLDSSERYLILPRMLGDLDKPECLAKMHDRIQELKQAKESLNLRQITQAEYIIRKEEILSKKDMHEKIKLFSNAGAKRTLDL